MICPLDYRYGREIVKNIFSERSKYRKMIEVEIALLKALEDLNVIPKGESEKVAKVADEISLEEIKEVEKITKHDVMALVEVLSKRSSCGYVHLGATSNDIIDTSTALQLKEFFEILEDDLKKLIRTLMNLSLKYRKTVMLGRTHGQAALPITFGWKVAGYLAEFLRHYERMKEMKKRVVVGKMMGAVGTGASFRELGVEPTEVSKKVGEILGINMDECPTQVVSRDRYIEFVNFMANIACSTEKIATEIRNLQRPEIGEVAEAFSPNQVGSSTMPHKKNPITSENICGLARIVRGFVTPMYESSILWHERDLSNSSAERFIIPHTCVLIDDILNKLNEVLSNIVVNEERMLQNLLMHPEILAERLMIYLVKKGYNRQEAHRIMREISMRGDIKKGFAERFGEAPEELFDPTKYTGDAERIVMDIVKKAKEIIEE